MDQRLVIPPPTPGQKLAAEIMAGIGAGFVVWMLLGGPGLSK